MSTGKHRLTIQKCDRLKENGDYSDGGNLYLAVRNEGRNKSWLFRSQKDGSTVKLGLGSYRDVSLEEAREKAAKQRRISAGSNEDKLSRTFAEVAEMVIETRKPKWVDHTLREWRNSLFNVFAPLHHIPVSEVDRHAVKECMEATWVKQPHVGEKLRYRVAAVLNHAIILGFRKEPNFATFDGPLVSSLPEHPKGWKKKYRSMKYKYIPNYMAKLDKCDCMSALALKMIILTGGRTGDVRFAKWSDFDFVEEVWTVRGDIHKTKKNDSEEHQVPLTPRVLELLEFMYDIRSQKSDYIFYGDSGDGHLSGDTISKFHKSLVKDDPVNHDRHVHGFRTTVRSFASEETYASEEVKEAILSHVYGSKTRNRYAEVLPLQEMHALLVEWNQYCFGEFKPYKRKQAVGFNGSQSRLAKLAA